MWEMLQVFGLGFTSVFDQVLGGLPEQQGKQIFKAYLNALDEDPDAYRKDAEQMQKWAAEKKGTPPPPPPPHSLTLCPSKHKIFLGALGETGSYRPRYCKILWACVSSQKLPRLWSSKRWLVVARDILIFFRADACPKKFAI